MSRINRVSSRALALLILGSITNCSSSEQMNPQTADAGPSEQNKGDSGTSGARDARISQLLLEALQTEVAIVADSLPDKLEGTDVKTKAVEAICEAAAKKVESSFKIPRKYPVVGGTSCGTQGAACTVKASCVGSTMTISLRDKCTGPFGLVDLDGQITVGFAVKEDTLEASIKTTEPLTAGSVSLTYEALAKMPLTQTSETSTQSLSITATDSATIKTSGEDPIVITEKGAYSLTKKSSNGCLVFSGSWDVTAGGESYSYDVTNVEKCAAGCASGGTTTLGQGPSLPDSGPRPPRGDGGRFSRSTTLTLDGTQTPSFAGTDGSGKASLSCIGTSAVGTVASTILYGDYGCTGLNGCMTISPSTSGDAHLKFTFDGGGGFQCDGQTQVWPGAVWYPITFTCRTSEGDALSLSWHALNDYYDLLGGVTVTPGGYSYPLWCDPVK